MKPPDNTQYLLFGGTFVLANKLQFVGDKKVNGLSTKQWFLLRNIMELPKEPLPTITQIAKAMDSTRQNITKMLESMEKEGLVAIERSESDSRSRVVRMTELGTARAIETAENAQGFLVRLFKGIESKEQEKAGKVLLKMMKNLEDIEGEISNEK